MKIRLDFSDAACACKTQNWFYNTLRERFDIEICDRPDYLIFADPLTHVHRVYNCVKIYIAVESFAPDFRICDYALTSRYLDDPRHLRLPYYAFTKDPLALLKTPDEAEAVLANKTKFCSFVVSSNHPRKTRRRIEFFKKLSKYKRVDSGGKFLNNIGGPVPPGEKIPFIRPYKFNIAFENGMVPGYTTEKIADAMEARCLPIYWGSPRIHEEFNPNSFLNYFDFPSEEALIEKIIELDRDDAKYLQYARQPYFHNNAINEWFSHERFLDFFEKIFTQKIRPVSERRSFFHLGRWRLVKRNKPHYHYRSIK